MSNSYSLKEGDKLTIYYREREFYTSAIQEVKDNGIITTYAPMGAKALLAIRPNDMVYISYVRADAQYQFDACVKRRHRQNGVNFLEFLPMSEHRRIQRRQYYRLLVTLDAYIQPLRLVDTEVEDDWIKVQTVDISGEGMQLKSFEPIPDHSILECMISLDDNKIIRMQGEVLEVFEVVEDASPYRLRIFFNEIAEDKRQDIIKFIFNQQQRSRAKGLRS